MHRSTSCALPLAKVWRWAPALSGSLAGNLLLGVSWARAQSAPASMQEPYPIVGTFVDYAEWATVALALLIPALIVLARILSRRREWHRVVHLLRFASLAAFPSLLVGTGGLATFEGAKEVEFCQSCHLPMGPYVSDMRNGDSKSLAALHYNNRYIQHEQCYTCHADYGVFGTVDAKLTGLNHMVHWLAGSDTARGEAPIEIYVPYRNELCFRCHAGSKRFLEAGGGMHVALAEQLTTTDPEARTSCLGCHGPAHETPEPWENPR